MKTRLKPMGIGTILDNSFTILREYFWTFQGVNFLSFLPALIIAIIGAVVVGGAIFPYIRQFGPHFNGEIWREILFQNGLAISLSAIFLIAFIVAMIIGSIYLTYGNMNLFRHGLHQEKCSIKQAFKGLKGKKWRFFCAFILIFLISTPVAIASVMARINYSELAGELINYFNYVIGFLFCLFYPVISFEKLGLFKSLSRAFTLMNKHRWRIFFVLILTYLLGYILLVAIMLLVTVPIALAFALKNLFTIVLACLFALTGLFVFGTLISFFYGPIVAIYYDLLIRKEGYDIQQQLNRSQVSPNIGQGIQT